MKTQLQMFYEAHRRIAERNNAFMDLVTDASNQMTKQDLERLIARFPMRYSMFTEYLAVLPDEVQA